MIVGDDAAEEVPSDFYLNLILIFRARDRFFRASVIV